MAETEMSSNYIFSLRPTFTQGLILGQLSILILLGLVLRYLFLDSTQYPFETSSYHPRVNSDLLVRSKPSRLSSSSEKSGDESAEWLNELFEEVRLDAVLGQSRLQLADSPSL